MMEQWLRKSLLSLAALMVAAGVIYLRLKRPQDIAIPRDLPDEERAQRRRIAFKGARNTRDLGGYPTADGRAVKWGLLYRSGDLSKLSRQDVNHFEDLGLAKVIDFRSVYERQDAPHRLSESTEIQIVNLPIEDANFGLNGELREIFIRGDVSSIDPDALLRSTYEHFVLEQTATYRNFFRDLLDAGGKPVLFNCTAGKDRTGFASALLLRILGVPEKPMMEDYLLTEHYAAQERKREIALVRLTRGKEAADIARQLLSVKPDYLQASFAAIENEYGSFEQYVSNGLQLNEHEINQLRAYYLE